MGASINIVGIIPANEEYKKAFRAWHACRDAGVQPPNEILVKLGIEPDTTGAPRTDGAQVAIKYEGEPERRDGAP